MTKQEAADFLGVTVRAIENYAAKEKIRVSYTAGKRGKVALYNEEDLEKLKAERGEVVYIPRPAKTNTEKPTTALAPVESSLPITAERFTNSFEMLAEAIRDLKSGRDERPSVSIAEKLVLSLKEASALAGISRDRLLAAIESKKLKASKDTIGRGWRIKRADLDAYVRKL